MTDPASSPSDLAETTLTSEPVYDGALLHVRRDTVRTPSGGTSVREWIAHPGASAVVALFDDGDTLLVRQYRYPPRREFLEVPAGKLDKPGEDPAETAQRELEEETGHRAGRLTFLATLYPCIGYADERIHVYLAEALTGTAAAPSEGEHVVPVRLPFARAVEMARRGEIVDMKTMSALVLADAQLAGRAAPGGAGPDADGVTGHRSSPDADRAPDAN